MKSRVLILAVLCATSALSVPVSNIVEGKASATTIPQSQVFVMDDLPWVPQMALDPSIEIGRRSLPLTLMSRGVTDAEAMQPVRIWPESFTDWPSLITTDFEALPHATKGFTKRSQTVPGDEYLEPWLRRSGINGHRNAKSAPRSAVLAEKGRPNGHDAHSLGGPSSTWPSSLLYFTESVSPSEDRREESAVVPLPPAGVQFGTSISLLAVLALWRRRFQAASFDSIARKVAP